MIRVSRIDAILSLLVRKGLSQEVAEVAARAQRDSSMCTYDCQWDRFSTFCRDRGVSALQASLADVSDYLLMLFKEGLAVNTLSVHKAAIASVLRFRDYDITQDYVITALFKRFWIDRPRTQRVTPLWDVNLVLDQFLRPPFVEKMGSCEDIRIPLPSLIIKVTFLLALATGTRRSELHALSKGPGDFRTEALPNSSGRKLIIRTYEGFLAKNQRPDKVPDPFVIPSLDHLVPDLEDRLWCPVRSLEHFKARTTGGSYAGQDRLLVHPDPKKTTTKGNVSNWLKKAITGAYVSANKLQLPIHARPHEVRAIAHSIARFDHATLEEIMTSARWRSSSTFTDHYLRNMPRDSMGEFMLRTTVVAGKIRSSDRQGRR